MDAFEDIEVKGVYVRFLAFLNTLSFIHGRYPETCA